MDWAELLHSRPWVKVFTDCHPNCAVIAFGLRANTYNT